MIAALLVFDFICSKKIQEMVLSTKISPGEVRIKYIRYIRDIPKCMLFTFALLLSMTSLIQLDKMLINYFVNSWMLSIYIKKIKNDVKERIYWVVSFQKNVKRNSGEILGHEKSWKVNRKNLLDEHGHFFLWLQL